MNKLNRNGPDFVLAALDKTRSSPTVVLSKALVFKPKPRFLSLSIVGTLD